MSEKWIITEIIRDLTCYDYLNMPDKDRKWIEKHRGVEPLIKLLAQAKKEERDLGYQQGTREGLKMEREQVEREVKQAKAQERKRCYREFIKWQKLQGEREVDGMGFNDWLLENDKY